MFSKKNIFDDQLYGGILIPQIILLFSFVIVIFCYDVVLVIGE